jgi:hypothetical protein
VADGKPKPKRIRKTAGRTPDQPKRGPLPWEPTQDERREIEHYTTQGYTQEKIAAIIGKTVDCLVKHCRKELDHGKDKVCARVGGKLYEKAMSGDVAAIIWWEKTRSGMKDTSRIEHTGANGDPIKHEQVNTDAESFTGRILSLSARQGTPSGDGETKH